MSDLKPVATFTLVVNYDDLPDKTDLDDLIEKAREYGDVQTAKLRIHRDVEEDLT